MGCHYRLRTTHSYSDEAHDPGVKTLFCCFFSKFWTKVRAILGNDVAIKAYREGKLPFPDGAIIARLAWSYVPSEENNKVFGRPQSFVAGDPTNVQFMVKNSKKYASTGGWGFAQFDNGKPAQNVVQNACFACHEPAKVRDFVFTRYAP
jgi:Cytochrome P460